MCRGVHDALADDPERRVERDGRRRRKVVAGLVLVKGGPLRRDAQDAADGAQVLGERGVLPPRVQCELAQALDGKGRAVKQRARRVSSLHLRDDERGRTC